MSDETFDRKLTAILSADVQGYSRLMDADEEGAMHTLQAYRAIMFSRIEEHRGRVVNASGDNVLAEFLSVVDAVRCAVDIQEDLGVRNEALPRDRRMAFRIGINLGDVVIDGDNIYGDGVNIAARLEGLAEGGGICISGAVFHQVENKLHLRFDDLGEHSVKNISRPVRVYRVRTEHETAKEIETTGSRAAPRRSRRALWLLAASVCVIGAVFAAWFLKQSDNRDKTETASKRWTIPSLPQIPSIAVLPFDNLSGDKDQEYIADGLTENIIAALSLIKELFVISRNSTFTYKGKSTNLRQVAEELGVRYVLEGSVQKSGDRVRITAQLIDAVSDRHIWAERYDRRLEDFFSLQDEITLKILNALEVRLTDGEQARVWYTWSNFEVWEYITKGSDHFERFTKDDNVRARAFFEKALAVEPDHSLALTMLAYTHLIDAMLHFSRNPEESVKKSVELAERAKALNENFSEVHSLWGMIYLLQRRYEEAVAEGKKAVGISPNNALGRILLAYSLLLSGEFDGAVAMAEKAVRLTPYCADWYLSILALSYRQAGRLEEALATYREALARADKTQGHLLMPMMGIVDVLAQLGKTNEAGEWAKDLLKINPTFSIAGWRKLQYYRNPEPAEKIAANFKKAGLPE